jgi:hypothetical protein
MMQPFRKPRLAIVGANVLLATWIIIETLLATIGFRANPFTAAVILSLAVFRGSVVLGMVVSAVMVWKSRIGWSCVVLLAVFGFGCYYQVDLSLRLHEAFELTRPAIRGSGTLTLNFSAFFLERYDEAALSYLCLSILAHLGLILAGWISRRRMP